MRVVLEASRLPERPGKPCKLLSRNKQCRAAALMGQSGLWLLPPLPRRGAQEPEEVQGLAPATFQHPPFLAFAGRGHADGGLSAREAPWPT